VGNLACVSLEADVLTFHPVRSGASRRRGQNLTSDSARSGWRVAHQQTRRQHVVAKAVSMRYADNGLGMVFEPGGDRLAFPDWDLSAQ
jgi:hypothetical protein